MLSSDPLDIIFTVVILVISLTIHEFAHAWTAYQLGDDTPRLNGRLTLNPLAHLDLMGSLMFILAGFGWAKPVPVNIFALQRRTPAGYMLVSIAGPFSNLLLAILAAIPFRMGLFNPDTLVSETSTLIASFLLLFIMLNLYLLFFNLIPIFPLDGEKVAHYFLPAQGQDFLDRIRPYGPMILIGLILIGNVSGYHLLSNLIGKPASAIFNDLIF